MAISINLTSFLQGASAPISGYPFSMAGWFRVLDVGQYVFLAGLKDTVSGARYEFFFAGSSDKKAVVQALQGSTSATARSTAPMISGQWHHLVGVFSADNSRKIILDGNSVTDTTAISFVAPSTFFVGSSSTLAVDAAEFALIDAAVSDEQAGILTKGCPILTSSLSRDVVAYYDLIRRTDRPGLGPSAPSAGTPGVVDHPPVFQPAGGWSNAVVSRVRGPWQVEQALYRPLSAELGQLTVAGVASDNAVLHGEVIS